MPRSHESPEGRILRYFRTAPLAMATLLLGLVKSTLLDRQPKVKVVKRHRRTKAEMTAAASVPVHDPVVRTKGGTPKRRKRVRVRPSRAKAAPVPTPEVEDFGSDK